MHRYCAGVSVEHYELLDQSPLPFNCSLCVQRKQAAIFDELKFTIAALTAEVAELRSTVSAQQHAKTDDSDKCKWSDVVARRPRRPRAATRSQSRTTNGNSRAPGAGASSVIPAKNVNQQKVTRVTVPGVRRVWGTKKDASTTVVLQTIRQLTKIDPEKRLTVKRKFQDGESGRRDRWWFLIRGSEATLGELESLWSCVSLQVGWKLEVCTKPKNDENRESNGNVDANPNSEESNDTLNGSSNSPAPSSANILETSETSCPNQPSIKQTGNVDINNVNSSQSGSAMSNVNNNTSSSEDVSQDHSFLDQTQHKTPVT